MMPESKFCLRKWFYDKRPIISLTLTQLIRKIEVTSPGFWAYCLQSVIWTVFSRCRIKNTDFYVFIRTPVRNRDYILMYNLMRQQHQSPIHWPSTNVNEVRRVNRNVCVCHCMIDGGYEYVINGWDYVNIRHLCMVPFVVVFVWNIDGNISFVKMGFTVLKLLRF